MPKAQMPFRSRRRGSLPTKSTRRSSEILVKLEKQRMKAADDGAEAHYTTTRTMMVAVAAVAAADCCRRRLLDRHDDQPGPRAVPTACRARSVAEGDLTKMAEITSQDEIGELLGNVNAMIERLRGVVADALSASDNVSSGSQELSASSEQVSQGATEQAASAEEASASMEQMAANIKQNADNAAQTEKIARQSAKDAEMSGEAVNARRRRHAHDRREDLASSRRSPARPTCWP